MTFQTIDISRFKRPQPRRRRSLVIWGCIAVIAILAAVGLYWFGNRAANPAEPVNSLAQPAGGTADAGKQQAGKLPAGTASAAAFDKQRYATDDPASPWVIVNKRRPLQPIDFTPELVTPAMPLRLAADVPEMQVSRQAAGDLAAMTTAAKQAGLELMLASGFRSYATQVAVYGNEVRLNGQTVADSQSARPGHSEHQTGLGVDLEPASRQCEIQDCFGELPEGKWLAANAATYGFVLRYLPEHQATTGYRYEPWHFRYVGRELAAELQRLGNPPLETFFGSGAAADYR